MAGQMLSSLHDLFVHELNDMLGGERQITEALPKMMEAVSSPQLKSKLQAHLQQTNEQIQRLEQIFAKLDITPEPESCKGLEGIISEGQMLLEMRGDPAVLDAGIIASAQKVEHYEMATYGTLRTWARTMGHMEIADMLQTTLGQESATDELLTRLAEASVNKKAA